MIGQLALDIITKAKSIESNGFGTTVKRVGLAAGGTAIDPLMEKVARPAAWVIFVGDQNTDQTSDQGNCAGAQVSVNFIVKIIMDYDTEADLINVQYPLLKEVIRSINGTQGPLGAKRWKYEGQTLDELSANRVVFDQRYSITTIL